MNRQQLSERIAEIRTHFPILSQEVYGHPLVYLDNAATTQKPREVIEAMDKAYYTCNANVHRGVHLLSMQATELHEHAREAVRRFINAHSTNEIVFTRGATESFNLLASGWKQLLEDGDEVILSCMEHHSNIVPWQLATSGKKIHLRVIPMNGQGDLDLDAYKALFTERTKLVSIIHVSNVLGTVNPVAEMIQVAHAQGVPCIIDAAQSIGHMSMDVQALDADFMVFSSHKMYGPTGVGVCYGKEAWLDKLPPYQGGGEMIKHVSFAGTTFNELPFKFEAGTPDYIGTIGLDAAISYLQRLGFDTVKEIEHALRDYALERLSSIPNLHVYGSPRKREALLSFAVRDIHPLDFATLLDRLGFALRTGHHCAQPLMECLGVESTMRASFAHYNTFEEIDRLAEAIERVSKMF